MWLRLKPFSSTSKEVISTPVSLSDTGYLGTNTKFLAWHLDPRVLGWFLLFWHFLLPFLFNIKARIRDLVCVCLL